VVEDVKDASRPRPLLYSDSAQAGRGVLPVKLDMPISDLRRMADAALKTLIEHITREAVDDEILAYRLQYAGVGYMLGVMLTQAHGRSALDDTTGRDWALDIVNQVLQVTGHRVVRR
jgi:hypothetical protein